MDLLEQLRCSGLFEARVPRYTSYPPVDQFLISEGKLHQKHWLNAVPHGAELSLYVHLPYCAKICRFCACRTQALGSAAVLERYVQALLKEIAMIRQELPARVSLGRLHLGGGTPALMTPDLTRALFEAIFNAFPKSPSFECAVELDTTELARGHILMLIELGMTRAILGIQDFDPAVQKAIGRHQTFEQILDMVRQLRGNGLERLDVEILHGLPEQTHASIAQTTQQVLSLEPDRVAVTEFAYMPSVAKRQLLLDALRIPAPEKSLRLFLVAREIILSDGYESVGMDCFARPRDSLVAARNAGTLRRDFQGYSDNPTLATIGIGASAISRFPQGYVQNNSATSVYLKNTLAGDLPANRGYCLTGTEKAVAAAIQTVMCGFRIDADDIAAKHAGSRGAIERAITGIGQIYGQYVTISGGHLSLKPEAFPLARVISETLDRIVASHDLS